MRRLALSDEILLSIDKPARYIGNEVNAVDKSESFDPEKMIRFCMCFPDVYEIGMSHLGIQILYDMFNKREDVWCERVYSPWPDLDEIMREKKIPLFALESQDPVRSFDFLGITIQYEMCYTNILQILDLSGIALHAADRGEDEPIVIGGGPCTYNPEPIAEFFDLFYIGEGEVAYDELFDLYQEKKRTGMSRRDFLLRASRIEGFYVPQFYRASYHEDGTLASFAPTEDGVPEKVRKRIVMDFSEVSYPDAPIVPYLQATQDRVVLEIQRGCIRGCRFCQAGMIYRPLREKNVERLKRQAEVMLRNTGYDEISLSSLSSSDYSELNELLSFLIQICNEKGINISLPSLRIDAFSLDVMSKVQDVKKSSLTFAAEAGSQRMRDVINKGITEEDILGGALEAFRGGWNKVKLYFMLGLPGENEEDVKDIAHLCQKVAECYYDNIPKEERTGKISITASSSFFVPKPFTPFQWARMDREQEFLDKAHMVKDEVRAMTNQKSIRYTYHDAYISVLEGVLARGDRRVAQAIETAYRKGAIFDAWTEYFDEDRWQESFRECGIDPYFYTARERDTSELLPWDFLDCQVSRDFLIREWKRAKEGIITPNCRQRCSGCGCRVYRGGVCYESQD
ncbi:TIGR03960 family B12-binding radical SAM protein [Bilifractor sp. LCP19S3_H10]|uniref:TIGR03960 family B12-binding radical SAM protein n=1 Tax=Bilifractor sp. LCP19S3_H10 TaxID=3438736 RepID=UPI003F90ABB2